MATCTPKPTARLLGRSLSQHKICQHVFQRSLRSLSAGQFSSSDLTEHKNVRATGDNVPLSRLSTQTLLRSVFLSTFFASSLLLKPGLFVMEKIANSQSPILNPDRNVILRSLIKPLIYDHFCAGRNPREVRNTIAEIKRTGYAGVILCYGKEAVVKDTVSGEIDEEVKNNAEITLWKDGILASLNMLGKDDWLAIRLTGAGEAVMRALSQKQHAPPLFVKAMDEICTKAMETKSRICIDAEQSPTQVAINAWTVDLMRKYNRGSRPVVYNTIQAYLKQSRDTLDHQLRLADKEGWTMAIKLVRGAYMNTDVRDIIHNTKDETDKSYDGIVRDLLQGTVPGLSPTTFPRVELLLAGHNPSSIKDAASMAQQLAATGQLKVNPEFAQLQGMADDVGCELLHQADEVKKSESVPGQSQYIPYAYKYLTWGSLQECMKYLVRRAIENQGATDRMRDGAAVFAKELWRRVRTSFIR